MDRPTLLEKLEGYVASTGVVAVMGGGSVLTARSDWTDALRELIQRLLGGRAVPATRLPTSPMAGRTPRSGRSRRSAR